MKDWNMEVGQLRLEFFGEFELSEDETPHGVADDGALVSRASAGIMTVEQGLAYDLTRGSSWPLRAGRYIVSPEGIHYMGEADD